MMIFLRFEFLLLGILLPVINATSVNEGVENVILNLAEITNTDIHFITDLSLPEMKDIPKTLGEESFPVFIYKVDDLVQKHKNSPQEKCPMVSAGHGAGHGDDHGDGHGDDHGDDHGAGHGDDHGDGHGNSHRDDHGQDHGDGHGTSHGEDHMYDHHDAPGYDDKNHAYKGDYHGELKIEDLQTDERNYFTIAKEFPNSFARPSNFAHKWLICILDIATLGSILDSRLS